MTTESNMFEFYNPNPYEKNVGDCTVRAISKALEQDWYRTYLGLCIEGAVRGDMPSANATWGAYLRRHGFRRDMAPEDMTVAEFAMGIQTDLHSGPVRPCGMPAGWCDLRYMAQ